MGTTTPNIGLYKPDLDEAGSSWYDDINANFDKLDAARLVLGKQHTASSHTGDTSETTLYSLVIPGGTIKANGAMSLNCLFSLTGSTNSKTLRAKLGGVVFWETVITGAATISQSIGPIIRNRNSQSSQVAYAGAASSTVITGAVDTSVDQTLTVMGQLANAGEIITLESVVVEVLR